MAITTRYSAPPAAEGRGGPAAPQAEHLAQTTDWLMGPTAPATAVPLMGPADSTVAVPVMGSASPAAVVPVTGPADSTAAVPVMGPSDADVTPVMSPRPTL